jgi:hypothetical protein
MIEKTRNGYKLTAHLNVKIDTDISYSGKYIAIHKNELVIFAGFEWDGASRVHDGKKINGIPINWKAVCIHDALYREKNERDLPLSYHKIDGIFRTQLKKYWYRNIWYHVVRIYSFFIDKNN